MFPVSCRARQGKARQNKDRQAIRGGRGKNRTVLWVRISIETDNGTRHACMLACLSDRIGRSHDAPTRRGRGKTTRTTTTQGLRATSEPLTIPRMANASSDVRALAAGWSMGAGRQVSRQSQVAASQASIGCRQTNLNSEAETPSLIPVASQHVEDASPLACLIARSLEDMRISPRPHVCAPTRESGLLSLVHFACPPTYLIPPWRGGRHPGVDRCHVLVEAHSVRVGDDCCHTEDLDTRHRMAWHRQHLKTGGRSEPVSARWSRCRLCRVALSMCFFCIFSRKLAGRVVGGGAG